MSGKISRMRFREAFFLSLTFLSMLSALYAIFIFAPTEKTMGVVQKIFYIHLPLAGMSFLAFFIVFLASILYLYQKDLRWDTWAHCSAEVGVVFCSLVLITGPIWARPVWNVWWTWDPRLTTTLILWFMYVAYLMIGKLVYGPHRPNVASVFGIISFVNVPLTFFAVRMWRTIHPVVIDSRGIHLETPMVLTLVLSLGAFALLFLLLLRLRVRLENILGEYRELKQLWENGKFRPIGKENHGESRISACRL